MLPTAPMQRRVITLIVAAALLPFAFVPAHAEDGPVVSNHTLTRPDGVSVAFTVFQPAGASSDEPVPLVFQSHGWGGTRASSIGGIVADLLDAGFGVLSFDARGHGATTGQATIHHKDSEVGDTAALLDWAHDNLNWVAKDAGSGIDKDIVVGAVGGSYGGGYQTTSATYDDRWDALVPQMTWNDLTYSLAPGGVLKTIWVAGLYGLGTARIDMDPRIHEWYWTIQATNSIPQAAVDHLLGSSPDPDQITAPTLFVQGQPDQLFNWNEAVANHEALLANSVETALVGYNGGHTLPHQPIGFMGEWVGSEPCGSYSSLALAWFDKHLRGNATAIVPTGVNYATEQNTCIQTASVEDNTRVEIDLGPVAMPSGAGSVLVPLDVAPGTLAGIPRLSGTIANAGVGTTAVPGFTKVAGNEHFFSLVVVDGTSGATRIIDDQSTAYRVADLPGLYGFELDMVGVASTLDADDQLFLRIDGANEWFVANGARQPGTTLATELSISLPFVEA